MSGVIDYAGGRRVVAGRLRFASPPEPGTILGPKAVTREYVVVLGQDEQGRTVLGYATEQDLAGLQQRRADGEPARSITEARP